jgi:hypothetical protein
MSLLERNLSAQKARKENGSTAKFWSKEIKPKAAIKEIKAFLKPEEPIDLLTKDQFQTLLNIVNKKRRSLLTRYDDSDGIKKFKLSAFSVDRVTEFDNDHSDRANRLRKIRNDFSNRSRYDQMEFIRSIGGLEEIDDFLITPHIDNGRGWDGSLVVPYKILPEDEFDKDIKELEKRTTSKKRYEDIISKFPELASEIEIRQLLEGKISIMKPHQL